MAARPLSAWRCALGLTLGLSGCNALDDSADHTMAEERVARPAAIVVQEFALSPEDAPPESGGDAGQAAERFRQSLASHLVSEIRAMGLPAVAADAPLPPAGGVVTLEGGFVSVPGGDSAEPAVVSLANAWPDVVVDVQIYDTSQTGDRLYEDMQFRISDSGPLISGGTPSGEPTEPPAGGSGAPKPAISPAVQARLEAAAPQGADAIAQQLRPFFEDRGWISRPAGS